MLFLALMITPITGQPREKRDVLTLFPYCHTPEVESLLLQTNFAKYVGRTRYFVCPKYSTDKERELSESLKKLKSIGLPEYLARRQRCRTKHWAFSASEIFIYIFISSL